MTNFLNLIQQLIDWYISTTLPYDTAQAFYKICDFDTAELLALMERYIIIIFGGVG